MSDRKCSECFEQLRGRTDQKFCSDHCRSSYNNRQYMESGNVMRAINRILKKNYTILNKLTSEGKTVVEKNDLVKKGYRFEYFTCVLPTRNNINNYFCYDHGYREKENNKLMLVQRNLNEDFTIHGV